MAYPELTALARGLARSDPRDQAEQTQNLHRLQEAHRYMRDKDAGLGLCMETAVTLINGLAWKGDLGSREILDIASQLVQSVEKAWSQSRKSAGAEPPEMPRVNDMVLGEVLVQLGFVTHDQVQEGLRHAQIQRIRIGEALVELGFTSEKRVEEGLRLQKKMRETARLEKIAAATPSVAVDEQPSPEAETAPPKPRAAHPLSPGPERLTVKKPLTVQDPRPTPSASPAKTMTVTREILLGEVLLGSEVITEAQLDQALEKQKKTGQRLGEVLIEMGAASFDDVEGAAELQKQLRLVAGLSAEGERAD